MKIEFFIRSLWAPPLFVLALMLSTALEARALPVLAVTSSNKLVLFESSAPGSILASVTITGLQGGETILGIDVRPSTGQLFALGSNARLYLINPATGAATFHAALAADPADSTNPFTALNGTLFGIDFNPTVDRLRVVSDSDQNLRIIPDSGLVTTDSSITYAVGDPNSGQNPNAAGVAYTNNMAGASATTLYGIDTNLDILVTQNPPNNGTLNTVGALGVNVDALLGFDIAPGPAPHTAYAGSRNPSSPGSSGFYTINLVSGAATFIGNIGGGELIRGITVGPLGTFQFSAPSYSVIEDCTGVDITVTRTGDLSQPASVDFATSGVFAFNPASERSDYISAFGTVFFNSGESANTFRVLINEDSIDEKLEGQQGEVFGVSLRNPTNGFLGLQSSAAVLIVDDPVEPATNVIDDTNNFVCQHYHDFLNREADPSGLAFWTNQIESCGANVPCREVKRINVSAAFFLSIEFQETGYLVYRTHTAAFGPTRIGSTVPLTIQEFSPDVQRIGRGVIVNVGDWEAQLEANKVSYFNEFVSRPAFVAAFPTSLTNAQYVDALNINAGGALSQAERDALVNGLNAATETRATVLRRVADDSDLKTAQFNRAFVLIQYFGYLWRNPNDAPDFNFSGYNFWLNKLNSFNGDFVRSDMVKSFILSGEYRQRFGP